MATIVQTIRKTRYLIDSTSKIYVFINYLVVIILAKNIYLINMIFINCLNLRLASTFLYLVQFELDVRYYLNYIYLISNAFSRYIGDLTLREDIISSILDDFYLNFVDVVYYYSITLVKIKNDFKEYFISEYKKNNYLYWILRVYRVVEKGEEEVSKLIKANLVLLRDLRFYYRNDLLYFINQNLY